MFHNKLLPVFGVTVALAATLINVPAGADPPTAPPGQTDAMPSAPIGGSGDHLPSESAIDASANDKGQEFLSAQKKLDDFGDWIESQPGAVGSGYLQQINHADTMSVELLWRGHDGLLTKALVQAEVLGIRVTVIPRSFNAKQAQTAADAVWAHAKTLAKRGITVSSVTVVSPDTDAIIVNGVFSGNLALPVHGSITPQVNAQVAASRQTVADEEAATVGVPVVLAEGGAPVFTTATRSADTAPFWAGGYMISPKSSTSSDLCSVGFTITHSGLRRPTTARHCVPPSGSWVARNAPGTSYGYKFLTDDGTATSALSVTTGGTGMFDGKWNDSTGHARTVKHSQSVRLNDYVCTSGGNSGVHCDIQVITTKSINDGFGSFIAFEGYQWTPGAIAVMQGDSGGPVFTIDPGTPSPTTVGAAGVIQAYPNGTGMSGSSCGSVHDLGSNTCSRWVLFSSMPAFLLNTKSTLYTA